MNPAAKGLNGAEIIFNPSATVAGLSQYLWELEQPASAVANACFIGAINRVGTEAPWNIGKFYGTSYFVNPRGEFLAQGSEEDDELVVADIDLSQIDEVRKTWQFYRDRRPEAYEDLVEYYYVVMHYSTASGKSRRPRTRQEKQEWAECVERLRKRFGEIPVLWLPQTQPAAEAQ